MSGHARICGLPAGKSACWKGPRTALTFVLGDTALLSSSTGWLAFEDRSRKLDLNDLAPSRPRLPYETKETLVFARNHRPDRTFGVGQHVLAAGWSGSSGQDGQAWGRSAPKLMRIADRHGGGISSRIQCPARIGCGSHTDRNLDPPHVRKWALPRPSASGCCYGDGVAESRRWVSACAVLNGPPRRRMRW